MAWERPANDTSQRALAVQAATAEPEHVWVENPAGGYSCAQCLEDVDRLPDPEPKKNAAAVELGRRGGLKGGKARAAALTPEQRSEIARKAAAARWGKK